MITYDYYYVIVVTKRKRGKHNLHNMHDAHNKKNLGCLGFFHLEFRICYKRLNVILDHFYR